MSLNFALESLWQNSTLLIFSFTLYLAQFHLYFSTHINVFCVKKSVKYLLSDTVFNHIYFTDMHFFLLQHCTEICEIFHFFSYFATFSLSQYYGGVFLYGVTSDSFKTRMQSLLGLVPKMALNTKTVLQ